MPRLASLLLALALACVLPSTADARNLIRGAFGHGTLVTAGAPCTTPAANPSNRRADCPGIEATAFDTCIRDGFDQLCDVRVTAQAPAGWRFARWSEQSNRCATSTIATCTIPSQEVNCDDEGENCVTNEPGPFVVIAEFVDTRAPTITNIAGPAQLDIAFNDARQQTFGFTTNEDDEAPRFRCQFDAAPTANCENPHRLNGLVDGIHRLCVTATDASGLASVPLCRTWQQETTPTVVLGNRPPAATTATDAAFTYTSNKVGHERDNSTLTFECRLDAAVFAACPADGTRFAGLGDGTHEFSVRAVFRGAFEPAGARHTSPVATHRWTVDTTPPDTTITSGPLDGSTVVDVAPTLAFSAGEEVTFTCRIDAGAALPCTSPFTTPALAAGEHSVTILATDAVGNADPTPATRTFTLVTGLATLKDADGDGFPEGLDCDDGNAGTRPGTPEVPGNGVDENCDGIVAPFPRITAVVSTNGSSTAKTTTFTRLLVTGVPAGAGVEVRCSGPKRACPFTRRLLTVTKGRANGVAQLSRKQRKRRLVFGVGATVEVRITAPAMIGKVRRLSVVKRKFPRGQDFCLAPGAVRPTAC